ncbi:MAG: OFA family MFS transporter [Proteobacteria bacterium]|nr:OFA family MFS transporter [Pseudomonadota bacterium]MBU1582808.1 OFA family MFS transporter [Pseudomonadota bacterium]MBU2453502.1 OFA family MFS transporter [Pseudomonadota bacterium]MBU2631615.1 OFA family MFS transporter [Pseudomonadota bacterium]
MHQIKHIGWRVTMAGLGINLALGILYSWSIFKMAIKDSITSGNGIFNWHLSALNDPYAVCCLVFAFTMIFAGRVQDRLSPRITAVIGGILTGMGLILISFSNAWISWIIGFGLFMGMGLGFGYASAIPPAIKWFPPARTGMIAGIVVAGFGLASAYIAPLSVFLIERVGLSQSMLIFGIAFLVIICALAQCLTNPPEGYVFENAFQPSGFVSPGLIDFSPGEMLRTPAFYQVWVIFCIASGAGLMIIGSVAGMAKQGMGSTVWTVVALIAVGNAFGRVVAGLLSDRIGWANTLFIMLMFQSVVIFSLLFIPSTQVFLLVLAATVIGFNYGTSLSLFPCATRDYFGMKNFGVNYGLVFSAWGVGGFIFPRVSQMIVAYADSPEIAYILASGLLLNGAVIALMTRSPVIETRKQPDVIIAPVPENIRAYAMQELKSIK